MQDIHIVIENGNGVLQFDIYTLKHRTMNGGTLKSNFDYCHYYCHTKLKPSDSAALKYNNEREFYGQYKSCNHAEYTHREAFANPRLTNSNSLFSLSFVVITALFAPHFETILIISNYLELLQLEFSCAYKIRCTQKCMACGFLLLVLCCLLVSEENVCRKYLVFLFRKNKNLYQIVVTIGSSTAFIFDGWFEQSSGCTVLVEVPIVPHNPYFKAELFPSLDAKLAANQDRYNRELHQGNLHQAYFYQYFYPKKCLYFL